MMIRMLMRVYGKDWGQTMDPTISLMLLSALLGPTIDSLILWVRADFNELVAAVALLLRPPRAPLHCIGMMRDPWSLSEVGLVHITQPQAPYRRRNGPVPSFQKSHLAAQLMSSCPKRQKNQPFWNSDDRRRTVVKGDSERFSF